MKRLKFTVLVDDLLSEAQKFSGLKAIHGFSMFIECDQPKLSILMDTGQSSNILMQNMKILGVNPNLIDFIFLSHGHYDHTGGLLELLTKMKKEIIVLAHPDIFKHKFKKTPELKSIGSRFNASDVESKSAILLSVKNSVKITNEIVSTGEIDRTTNYEQSRGFWTIQEGKLVYDELLDDQALIFNIKNKGLVVISGCAHSGIINTVRYSQKLMGVQKIHAVVGGFHLKGANKEKIQSSIQDLINIDPDVIYPCHCTGLKFIKQLNRVFKERCRILKTGDKFSI